VTSVEAQDACRVTLETTRTMQGVEGLLALSGDPDMYGSFSICSLYLNAAQLRSLAALALIVAQEIERAS
jgi:hypothetical protein